jgi:hypothetical protein
MKIYLQDSKTLKFIRCDSSWSSDFAEALDFLSIRRAITYGLTQLKEVFQLVQVDLDGLHSHIAITRQLPEMKVLTPSRPVRLARPLCVARKIFQRPVLCKTSGRPANCYR